MPIHRSGTDIQTSFLEGRRKRVLSFVLSTRDKGALWLVG